MSTTSELDRIVEDYLRRLDAALEELPPSRRVQLVDDLRAHIAEGRSRLEDPTESDIRTLLDRLGTPEEIADESLTPATRTATRPPRPLMADGTIRAVLSESSAGSRGHIEDKRYLATGITSGTVAIGALVGGSLYGQVNGFLTWQRSLVWVCALIVLVFGLLATTSLSLASVRAVARPVPPTLLVKRYWVIGIVAGTVALGVLGAWSLDGHRIGSLVQRVLWWGCPIALLFFGLLAAACLSLASIRTIARSMHVAAVADGVTIGVTGMAFTVLSILFVFHAL